MKYKNFLPIFLLVLAGIIAFAGCAKKGISGLVKCEGIVLWNGEPVEEARIAFIPKSSSNGRDAFAVTDATGKFKTTTLDVNDGILPGEYFVTITKKVSKRGGVSPESRNPGEDRDGKSGGSSPMREEFSETWFLPRVYSNQETSGMDAVIPAKGKKDLKFELEGEITD